MKPKRIIKKGYCLIVATDKKENLCKNCFFHNPNTEIVQEKRGRYFFNVSYPGCLRNSYMPCPSKAHLKSGKNIIYKLIKINEVRP